METAAMRKPTGNTQSAASQSSNGHNPLSSGLPMRPSPWGVPALAATLTNGKHPTPTKGEPMKEEPPAEMRVDSFERDAAWREANPGKHERREPSAANGELRAYVNNMGEPEREQWRATRAQTNAALAAFYDEHTLVSPPQTNPAPKEAKPAEAKPAEAKSAPKLMDTGFLLEFPPMNFPEPVRADNLNEGFPSGTGVSAPKGPSGQAAHPFPPFKGLVEEPVKSEPLPAPNPHVAAALNFGFPSELLHGST